MRVLACVKRVPMTGGRIVLTEDAQAIDTRQRTVTSLDGPIEVLEQVAHCPVCRRDFFPAA